MIAEKDNKSGVKILTHWKGMMQEYATWEDLEEMKRIFSHLVSKIL